MSHALSDTFVKDILNYLDCPTKAPTLRYLNRLLHTYIRRVPWESVSRILKRQSTSETKDCPRPPKEFWSDAMRYGFGGTCYESSLAFYSLLTALGYKGYLTVNDMGDLRGCHAAIVVLLGDEKYLVDNTVPVHSAVRLKLNKVTRRRTAFHNYTIRPVHKDKYEVERSHHPDRNAFTLVDIPVRIPDYQRIMENDYKESGYFLTSVVMVKVIGDRSWQFVGKPKSYKLESFNRAGKMETPLESKSLPNTLAELFHMPKDRISAALSWVESLPVTSE